MMLRPANVPGARKGSPPRTPPKPQLATASDSAPEGPNWLHEIKYDGYRMLSRIDRQVELFSRNGRNWTDKLKSLAPAVQELPAKQAILDGEVVVFDRDGVTSFQALQNGLGTDRLVYMVFDVLYLDGVDLTAARLEDRKELLRELLRDNDPGAVRYSEHIAGNGPQVFRQAQRLGTEGIISKRRDRSYRSGRTTDWLKIKALMREEFVVGGFTEPEGSRTGFGALLLGRYSADGGLTYCGRVGTGFTNETLVDLAGRLSRLERKTSPFNAVPRKEAGAGTHWVKPEVVVQVEFSQWSREGHLRHPVYRGMREDKPAREVIQVSEVAPTGRESRVATGDVDLPDVRMTSPGKVLYPEIGLTKLGLAEYYASIADWILPHIVDRPLSLVRCPDGWQGKCFYQKRAPVGLPDHVQRTQIGDQPVLWIRDLAGLLSLVQFGVLEIHTWGAQIDRPDRPDRLTFDLDPDPELPWQRVVQSAIDVRTALQGLGLESFLKTTGGKGLHVVVPIVRRTDWNAAKKFCRDVASSLAKAAPQQYTISSAKKARTGKVYIDYLRNSEGATSVAPYSTRAREGAPVSVPLDWNELTTVRGSNRYDVGNTANRLSTLTSDPWEGLPQVRQSIAGRQARRK